MFCHYYAILQFVLFTSLGMLFLENLIKDLSSQLDNNSHNRISFTVEITSRKDNSVTLELLCIVTEL